MHIKALLEFLAEESDHGLSIVRHEHQVIDCRFTCVPILKHAGWQHAVLQRRDTKRLLPTDRQFYTAQSIIYRAFRTAIEIISLFIQEKFIDSTDQRHNF
ncbi:uncharacterized protein Bfra_008986 [Botrytis fragariae]|uniref:Uncharacterized protein n=1 Tax=Botrytis fragariae TaxID=1964551 RepID=A0A8H6AQW0_9HELO|nr:uncharacterized protein Bfra_008986 [Botrytis fragariae]KAF5871959.1 hypothetical protein Bfra_008986 [Botrytis fragariae]